MKLLMSLHAYDSLDQVQWSLVVREYPDYESEPSPEATYRSGFFRGEGIDDPLHWVAEALEHILEAL